MDKELEQQAIQTFATVPEIYQQAFREAGADFPDELVGEIKKDPNQAISLLESNKNLKSAVINIYKQNKDAILQYMQQNTSMFREGGKFDYLKKLQGGGTSPEKLQGDLKPKGFRSLFFKATRYPREDRRPGYISEYVTPAGDTTTTIAGRWNQWQRVAKNGQQPIYQIAVGSEDYKPTLDQEAIEMLNNVHNRFTYPVKEQEGGRLTRKQALEAAQKNRGFTRQQARRALRNARYAGADRQTAFAMIAGEPSQPESNTPERPQLINSVNSPVGDIVSSNIETINTRPTTDYSNVDFGVFNFNNAFDRARKAGLNEFTWNGKRYTTQLSIPALGPDGNNYSIADTLLSNSNISTPDWWISKQYEIPTALSIGIDPSSAIRAREIHPPLRREGGKLFKENEANKKYIKASEKAGAKASKEMSDLKAKHKAELKKVRKGQEGMYTERIKSYDGMPEHSYYNEQTFPNSARRLILYHNYKPVDTLLFDTKGNGWHSPFTTENNGFNPSISVDMWNKINQDLDAKRDSIVYNNMFENIKTGNTKNLKFKFKLKRK